MHVLTRLKKLECDQSRAEVWGVSRGLWEMVFTMGDNSSNMPKCSGR